MDLKGATALPLVIALQEWQNTYDIRKANIEHVSSVSGSSAGSNFAFGESSRLMVTLIEVLAISLNRERPKSWQKRLGATVSIKYTGAVRTKKQKQKVAEVVTQHYPHISPELYGPKGGLKDGRSDSLALAISAHIQFK